MKRSRVNLSHTHLTTMEMGKLVPFFWQDCLPGDVARIATNAVIKGQPMIAPLMHRVNILTQYYFVPYRILWDNWTEFITGGESGTATPEFPWMTSGTSGVTPNTLLDYLGIPINQANLKFSALPARAYNQIWNDHYKVDDIENEIDFITTDGEDTLTPTNLLNCHWARDRFTRAKPFTQRGAQINVPIVSQSQEGTYYEKFEPKLTIGTTTYTKPTSTKLGTIYVENQISYFRLMDNNNQVREIDGLPLININEILPIEFDITAKPSSGYFEIIQSARKQYPDGHNLDGSVAHYFPSDEAITNYYSTNNSISGVKDITGKNNSDTKATLIPNAYLTITAIEWGTSTGISNTKPAAIVKSITPPTTQDTGSYEQYFNTYAPKTKTIDNVKWIWGEVKAGTINAEIYMKQTGTNASLNIRDLRVASALQRFQEKSLKYGAEYEDYCKMEFGVKPRDSRLNKSEYLGGSQTILQISEVLQTADGTDSALGSQAGYSIGTARSRKIKYFCPEHGIIIGLCSIRPETIYTQGIDRDLLKTERFDFWTREMVGIGAQEIKAQEIFATADNAETIFGYDLNGNYREYYSKRSRVSGNFRTDLNFWHLGRFFNQPPALNSSFIEMNPRKDIFAITDQTLPAFLCYFQNSALFYRPIPKRVKNKLA